MRAKCLSLRGSRRQTYLPAIWSLYKKTYHAIGLHLATPTALMKYDLWEVCEAKGRVRRFSLWKETPYGLKFSLIGHDDSTEAKQDTIADLRTVFHKPSVYGEVSHAVKDIVLASGAPVVCATIAGKILNKKVRPTGALTYRRSLGAVGDVEKMLVGQPRGIPTTDALNPTCPMASRTGQGRTVTSEADQDLSDHWTCVALALSVPSIERLAARWLGRS